MVRSGAAPLSGRGQALEVVGRHRTGGRVVLDANGQTCEVLWLVGQHDPWHRRGVGAMETGSAPIRCMNRERAEADRLSRSAQLDKEVRRRGESIARVDAVRNETGCRGEGSPGGERMRLRSELSLLLMRASNAFRRRPTSAEGPDVGIVACIEGGVLEAQALLLFDSIRRYGGRLSQCSLYALSPRAGHAISSEARKRLDELEVTYSDVLLNNEI